MSNRESARDALDTEPSGWRTRLNATMIADCRASGAWRDRPIGAQLRALAKHAPNQTLFIDDSGALSVSETLRSAQQLAMALSRRGIRAGEVVSFQLPNWREAVLVDLACALAGFVCNPIVPIYRDMEVQLILSASKSRALFLPEQFRSFDYRAMIDRIARHCPSLKHIVFVRDSAESFSRLINEGKGGVPLEHDPEPNHVKMLLYTSGTTSAPKGVLHTHNTIDAEVRNFSRYLRLDHRDVILMPSTVGHITGYLYGIQMPITLGAIGVLMERWDPATAADLIDRLGVTFTIGATPFLQELTRYAIDNSRRMPSLRLFPCGGAAVPPSVVYAAEQAFARCSAFRLYGSTEAPTITLGILEKTRTDMRAETEGMIVGHEVRIVDSEGTAVNQGQEGEILTRGPEVFIGYTDWQQNSAFDTDGFFHTGDVGRIDANGCLTITGRIKDIIIRGGEKFSAKEVEDVIYTHPAIREAAVVAMSHPRLGETGCACVTLKEQAEFDMNMLRDLMLKSGVAKQKWPEHLEIMEALPLTPSGKVKKAELRDLVKDRRATGEL